MIQSDLLPFSNDLIKGNIYDRCILNEIISLNPSLLHEFV